LLKHALHDLGTYHSLGFKASYVHFLQYSSNNYKLKIFLNLAQNSNEMVFDGNATARNVNCWTSDF